MQTAEDDETERTLFFRDDGSLRCGGFGGLALDTAELLGVGEHDVHVLRDNISTRCTIIR